MIPFSLQTGTHTSILIPSIKCFGCFFFTFSFPLFFFIIYSFILCLIFKYFRSGDTCVWIPWFNHIFICSLVVFPFVNAEIKKENQGKKISKWYRKQVGQYSVSDKHGLLYYKYIIFQCEKSFYFFLFQLKKKIHKNTMLPGNNYDLNLFQSQWHI